MSAARRRRLRILALALGVPMVLSLIFLAFLWTSYARRIDARLGGETRAVPRIFGRPFELQPGQGLLPAQLEQRLNDVGYAERGRIERPGEFSKGANFMMLMTRGADGTGPQLIRVEFSKGNAPVISKLTVEGKGPIAKVALEAPMLTALAPGEKRRYVPLANIPRRVVEAVLAIEDHRFYDHPGVDPIGTLGAVVTNLRGNKPYLVGGSTITQQIVKNTFLTPAKTPRRKLQEQFMALVMESRLSKDRILELYLNEVVLGQRGPFEIHGVAEAARIFFGKDVSNVSLAEAATIAGIIQSPSRLNPFRHPDRARERRNVVLDTMAQTGFIAADAAARASTEPLTVAPRALENAAPYFVDYVSQVIDEVSGGGLKGATDVDVYTTLDLQLQRIAQEAIGEGIAQVDKQLAARKRPGQAQAALIAIRPGTGEILAMVGGRAYSQSQYNRVVAARRQPGSVFKPFVYLAAFEKVANEGLTEPTPATLVVDEPTVFTDGEEPYEPSNYQNEYDGPITLRRALALSRNIVAIKVAQMTGYDQVADLWKRIGAGTPAKAYPSIALGVFEATPLEIGTAYTLFTNSGAVRPLRAVTRVVAAGKARAIAPSVPRRVSRPETAYLVTHMMRSVLNEGTGASARASFRLDAAGKSGTTNDLRDAWFVGFTPDLLTVVWVGFDDNRPIGMSGTQAALPIWTAFMRRATAGRLDAGFPAPEGVVFADIDKDTGQLATAGCPRTFREVFLAGTEPREFCRIH